MGFAADGDGGSLWCSTAREVKRFATRAAWKREGMRSSKLSGMLKLKAEIFSQSRSLEGRRRGKKSAQESTREDPANEEKKKQKRQLTYFSSSRAPFNFPPIFLLLSFLGGSPTAGSAFGSLTFFGGRARGFFSFGTVIVLGFPTPLWCRIGPSSPSFPGTTPPFASISSSCMASAMMLSASWEGRGKPFSRR